MDNPEKTAKQGTQDEDKKKQNYNTICVVHQTDRIKYIVRP